MQLINQLALQCTRAPTNESSIGFNITLSVSCDSPAAIEIQQGSRMLVSLEYECLRDLAPTTPTATTTIDSPDQAILLMDGPVECIDNLRTMRTTNSDDHAIHASLTGAASLVDMMQAFQRLNMTLYCGMHPDAHDVGGCSGSGKPAVVTAAVPQAELARQPLATLPTCDATSTWFEIMPKAVSQRRLLEVNPHQSSVGSAKQLHVIADSEDLQHGRRLQAHIPLCLAQERDYQGQRPAGCFLASSCRPGTPSGYCYGER